jgi:hypothetical protein
MTPAPRVLALMVAYNEADVIGASIDALIADGCDVYVVDHGSTDGTGAIARERLGRGVIGVERFPEDAGFDDRNETTMVWSDLLRRREQLVAEHDYDWYVLNDADEFRESPWPGLTLAEAFGRAERLGFNAATFRVFDFRPVDGRFQSGQDPRAVLTGWEAGKAFDSAQVKAFKRLGGPIDVVANGGHDVRFEGRQVCPVPFLLRHYAIRSPEHGARKVLAERLPRFASEERDRGWHVQYDELVAEGARFTWDPDTLTEWDPGAVRAQTLADAVELLLLAAHTRGQALDRVVLDEDGLRRHVRLATGAEVTDGTFRAAVRVLDDLHLGGDAQRAAASVESTTVPVVLAMMDALLAQLEVGGEPAQVSRMRAQASAFAAAAADATSVALDGARGFVTLLDARELLDRPALASAFARAFDADSDATLVIHAPGWSDERVAERLVPALAQAGLDGPYAPDAMALTARVDHRLLASGVHAVLTSGPATLDGVPHTDCDEALRSLAAVAGMAADLRLLNDVLAGTPIAGRYWLFGGLVLAYAREGALMSHDVHDADFAVLAEDMPRLEASFGALRAAGFAPLHRFPGAGAPATEFSFVRDGRKFEFFRIDPAGDRFRFHNYAQHGDRGPVMNVCELPAQPREEIRFLDRTWLKVVDHDAELTANYGDWRTPNPDWDYLDSPSIVATEPWDPSSFAWQG